MLKGDYPEHDMNKVFDMVYQTIEAGGTDDKCKDEADFLMHLFAGLPAEAVEYGMMFLHGKTDLPAAILTNSCSLEAQPRIPKITCSRYWGFTVKKTICAFLTTSSLSAVTRIPLSRLIFSRACSDRSAPMISS